MDIELMNVDQKKKSNQISKKKTHVPKKSNFQNSDYNTCGIIVIIMENMGTLV